MITKGLVRTVGLITLAAAVMTSAQSKMAGKPAMTGASKVFHDLLDAEWEYGLKVNPT